ncbi:nascent polypeptide-associated complex subunit alpha, muscle-specific form-like isoform X2 [Lethenteron reissneri]|uniref:nascent polypeptide-associated complex subunit alpha, muscle-specific form-like isoform X2 n=1 Tax=Lethenteron reissneri TaxID=7753 RepID=UPI002AB6F115|nr:nascent polypeptide-associated complex subunit alpha, muscle-specific form-like isoform X2 [Lethenteron reissneri]
MSNMDYGLVTAVFCLCLGSCNALAVHVIAQPQASVHMEGETVWIVCSVKPSTPVTPDLRAPSDRNHPDLSRAVNYSTAPSHKAQSQSKPSSKTKNETPPNVQAKGIDGTANPTPVESRRPPPSEQRDLEILIGESPPTGLQGDAAKSLARASQLKPMLGRARTRRAKTPNAKIPRLISKTLDNSTEDDQNLDKTKLAEHGKERKQGKPANKAVDVSNATLLHSASRTTSVVGVRKKMPENRTKSLTLTYRSKQSNQTSSQAAKKVEQGARPGSPKLPAKNPRLTKFEKTPRLSQPKQTALIANQHHNQTKPNSEKPKHKGPVKTAEHSSETQTQRIGQHQTNEKASLPSKSTQSPAVKVQNRNTTSQHDPDQQAASSRLTKDHTKPVRRISSAEKSTESVATDTIHQNNSRLGTNLGLSRATQKGTRTNKPQERGNKPGRKITAQAHATLKTPLQNPPLEVTLGETDVKDETENEPTKKMHVLTGTSDNILEPVQPTQVSSRQRTTIGNVLTMVKAADSNLGRLNRTDNTNKTGQLKPKPPAHAHPDKKQPTRQVPERKGSDHKKPLIKTPGHLTPQKTTETHNKLMVVPTQPTFRTTTTTTTKTKPPPPPPEHARPTRGISTRLEVSKQVNSATARPVDHSHELVVQWLLAGVDGSEVEIARRDRRGKLKVAEEFRERQRTGGLDLSWDPSLLALSLSLSPAVRADVGTYRCVVTSGWEDEVLNASAEVKLRVLRPDSNIYPHPETPSTKGPNSIEEMVFNEGVPMSISQELYILTVAVSCLGLISLLLFLSIILHRHRTRKHRSTSAASRSFQDCKCSLDRSHSKVNGCTASDHQACTNSAKVIKTLQDKFAENRASVARSSVCTLPEPSTSHSADLPPEPRLISAEELVPCDVTYAALDLTRPVATKPQPLPRTIYAQISFSQTKNG